MNLTTPIITGAGTVWLATLAGAYYLGKQQVNNITSNAPSSKADTALSTGSSASSRTGIVRQQSGRL